MNINDELDALIENLKDAKEKLENLLYSNLLPSNEETVKTNVNKSELSAKLVNGGWRIVQNANQSIPLGSKQKIFDPSKPVQTRDGHPARIICTDAKSKYPIIALLEEDRIESAWCFTSEGKYMDGEENDLDLINI